VTLISFEKIINKNKIFLYLGIFAYLIGILLLYLFSNFSPQETTPQQPLFKILQAFPPLFVYFLVLIQASVIEEFAFRGWMIKRKFGKYLSFSLIITFFYIGFGSLLLILIITPILFVVFFILKNKKIRLVLLILSTSILFGLMHYHNYESWAKLFSIIQLIGLSLILCYVGLRFGFIYTILGHFINNLIALSMLTLFANSNYTCEFDGTTYNAKITKISSLEFSDQASWIFSDSISANGYITQIASELPSFNNTIIYFYSITDLNRYNLIVTQKSNDGINKDQLFKDYIKYTGLILDTAYSEAYVLDITDTLKLINHSPPPETTQETHIQSLTTSIRSIYELPLILDDNYIDYSFSLDWKLFRIKSSEEFVNRLKNEYGILLTKDSTKKATIITIRE
jgi:membrane protease YdiL (CAAX protease family)